MNLIFKMCLFLETGPWESLVEERKRDLHLKSFPSLVLFQGKLKALFPDKKLKELQEIGLQYKYKQLYHYPCISETTASAN